MRKWFQDRVLVYLFLGAGVVLLVVGLVLFLFPKKEVLVPVDLHLLRSSTGFFCLGEVLISAPDGLEVYGSVPQALRECSPRAQPLAGASPEGNYVLNPRGGWIYLPAPPEPRGGEKKFRFE